MPWKNKRQLWFDTTREKIFSYPLDCQTTLCGWRDVAILDLYTTAQFSDRRNLVEKAAAYPHFTPEQIRELSERLRFPRTADPLNDVASSVRYFRNIYESLQTEEVIYLAGESLRHLVGMAAYELIASPNLSEVLLMDEKLARDIAESADEELCTDELQFVPYPRCIVEFSRALPVKIPGVNTPLEFTALGFRADDKREIYSAHLYARGGESKENGCPVNFSVGRHHFVSTSALDYEVEKRLNNAASNATIAEHLEKVIHNLWAFLTSHSVNYDTIQKTASERRVYERKGMQALSHVTVVRLNQDVRPPRPPSPHPSSFPLTRQVKVPGRFHTWVYCKSCGDTHRHDLVGQPCRQCRVPVGPEQNLDKKRYWHPPHTRGPSQ